MQEDGPLGRAAAVKKSNEVAVGRTPLVGADHGLALRLGDDAARRRDARRARGAATSSASSRPTARPTCSSTMLGRPRSAACRCSSPAPAGRRTCPGWPRRRRRCPCSACRSSRRRSKGIDSLLSIVQMPAGIPVGTLAIGRAGAVNAALLAAAILARGDEGVARAAGGVPRRADAVRARRARSRA